MPKDKKLKIFCGTPTYMAPEILKKIPYDGRKTDIWSLGVCLFRSLTDTFPFEGMNENSLFSKIKIGKFIVPKSISNIVKALLHDCLNVDTEERLNSLQVMSSAWFSKECLAESEKTTADNTDD